MQQKANATIANCLFENNRVSEAIIFAQFLSFTIESSFFTNHSTALQLESASAFVISSTFASVEVFSILSKSNLVMRNSTVRELIGISDCLISGVSSNISFVDMTLENITCKRGVVTLLSGSRLRIDRTLVKYVESGSSVLMINSGDAVLTGVTLMKVESAQLILLANTTLIMREAVITDSDSSLIQATEANVTLENCHFARIRSQNVGILACSACYNISVSESIFEDISAGSVAGIYAKTAAFQVTNSVFLSLEARDSGALRIDAVFALISACRFLNNTASSLDSNGGALRLNATTGLISTSLFSNNKAASGGAVHWIAGAIRWQNNTFMNNTANYGPDFASFPIYLQTDQDQIPINSGYMFQSALIVRLLDHFNQVVSTDNSSVASLESNLPMSGSLQAKAVAGRLIFTSFSVTAQPGSRSRLTVATPPLYLPLELAFRSCDIGEMEIKSMCSRCAPGTYSLSLNATECKLCPKYAQCPGGSQIYPDSGYWRPDPQFEQVLQCPRADACLGHVNFTSEVGYCADHYTGNMCQSCVTGTGRTGRDGCATCASNLGQELRAVGLGVWLIGHWLFISSISSSEELIALFRIAVDYLQFMALVADFDLGWPAIQQGFYSLHHYLGNAFQHFLLIDCLTSDAFFVSTLAAALTPLVLILLFAFLWTVIRLICAIRKLSRPILKKYVSMIIVSFLYLHCFILRTALNAFHCITINPEESWLRADMSVRCWNKRHLTYALAISLPTTLLWGIFAPGVLLLLQIRRHRSVNVAPASVYLSAGFKDHLYFWELVIVCFKACVVVLYVSMGSLPPSIQALSLVLLLSAVIALQSYVTPFKTLVINHTQWVSFTSVLVTAYSGIYFSNGEQSPVLTVFVLLFHCCFAVVWGLAMFRARLKNWLRRWFRETS